jgi:hypothetical protein
VPNEVLGLLPGTRATLTAQGDDGGPGTSSGGGSGELSSREEVEGGENGSQVAHGGLRGAQGRSYPHDTADPVKLPD